MSDLDQRTRLAGAFQYHQHADPAQTWRGRAVQIRCDDALVDRHESATAYMDVFARNGDQTRDHIGCLSVALWRWRAEQPVAIAACCERYARHCGGGLLESLIARDEIGF